MASGTIAYCSREDHSFPGFAVFLARLAQHHPDAEIVWAITNDIADGRNQIARDMKGDWLWFIDPDMVFAPETIERLLAHQVDAVQVLCLKRHPPHEPVLWDVTPNHVSISPVGRPRLVEVQSLGAGGTLYRRRCFEAVSDPWFEGVLGLEDTNFAQKLRAAGVPLYVDLATRVGHVTPMIVWPHYVDGQWSIRYDSMNGKSVMVPAQRRAIDVDLVGSR